MLLPLVLHTMERLELNNRVCIDVESFIQHQYKHDY